MNVTINSDQNRFVIQSGGNYSCLSFLTCFRESQALAERLSLGHLAPSAAQIGQLEQYDRYLELLEVAREYQNDLGTWYDPRTARDVIAILEWARVTHTSIRLIYGDVDTGNDWLNEFDVIGRVGRDSGILKAPVLLGDHPDHGGPIFDHCVLRILEVSTKRELYCHPLYLVPDLTLVPIKGEAQPMAVFDAEKLIARFDTAASGSRWIAFMTGDRMSL